MALSTGTGELVAQNGDWRLYVMYGDRLWKTYTLINDFLKVGRRSFQIAYNGHRIAHMRLTGMLARQEPDIFQWVVDTLKDRHALLYGQMPKGTQSYAAFRAFSEDEANWRVPQ